jgi:hypothetical protein
MATNILSGEVGMFWNRRKKAETLLSEPRQLHYLFAHVALREMCAADPLQFFTLMASDGQQRVMTWLWGKAQERAGGADPSVAFSEVQVTTLRVSGYPTVLVQMPRPRAPAEAHFVAVVLTGDLERDGDGMPLSFRYFALECGLNMDGTTRMVFCEWADGAHRNFGDGPAPEAVAFIEAVTARI